MVAQRQRADYLLKASVESCIDYFWTVQKYNRIPVPIIGALTIGSAYKDILATLMEIWKIKTNPPDFIFPFGLTNFLQSLLGLTEGKLLMKSMGLAYNILGPLSGSITAKIILKVLIGYSLMFERLFWTQQEQGDNAKPFTLADAQRQAGLFAWSSDRQTMSDIIEKSISLRNCYSKTLANAIAEQAIDAAKKK